MSSEQSDSSVKDSSGIDFLDFLFTVAISVGLTPEALGVSGIEGLLSLSQKWKIAWPDSNDWFYISSFFLGLINLSLSWFGYHASIRTRPLKYSSSFGMIRFIIDIFLVIVYGIMLIQFTNLNVIICILLAIYLIFSVWDAIKIREYREEFNKKDVSNDLERYRREWVTLFAFMLVGIVAVLHFYLAWNRWVILGLAFLVTVFYRFNKLHRTWERLFLRKDGKDKEGNDKWVLRWN